MALDVSRRVTFVWPAVERRRKRWLSQSFKPSSTILSVQPSPPTLTSLNPDNGSPVLGRSLQGPACQGSPCRPLAGTQACALKLSPPPTAAGAGGNPPLQKSLN